MFKRGKKIINKLLILMMCTSLVSTAIAFSGITNVVYASAATVSAESDFTFDATTGTIGVYNGSDTTLVIPSTINGVPVKSIGSQAWFNKFSRNSTLTSITIPNSVTSIGDYAFNACSGLTSITIPDSVTSIGVGAFNACSGLTSIIVSDNKNYTSIDGILFNKSKTKIIQYPSGKKGTAYTIPDSVTSIGVEAFDACSGLTSITIPNSVTSIGESAFWYCSNLTSITIPNSVTSIGANAFGASCSSLTSITIPNSVTSIGVNAFSGCSSLTSITIPNSVTSIGEQAFSGCSSLKNIIVSNNKNYTSIDGILFNKSKTKLIKYPEGKKETTYTIPNSVTSIGSLAFYGCSGLTSIAIPNSVTSIGVNTFYGCTKATFYVWSEKIKQLLINGYINASKIKLNTQANQIKVTGITLNKTSLSVVKGKTATLTATVAPTGATNKTVTWKSSDSNIATVDSAGKIIAKKAGKVTITCTAKDGSNKSATCKVTVINPVSVASVKLNKTTLPLKVGKTSTLTATVAPTGATNKTVTWKSSNTAIATVDSTGKITAKKAGKVTITCTTKDGSKTAKCIVTITK